jgi:hypothetical protein
MVAPSLLKETGYGNFPSVLPHGEYLRKASCKSVDFIQELKIRGSYGSVGNQNIRDLQYLSTYTNNGGRFGYSLGTPPCISWQAFALAY